MAKNLFFQSLYSLKYIKIIMVNVGFIKEKFPTTKLGRKNPRGGRSAPPRQLGLSNSWNTFCILFGHDLVGKPNQAQETLKVFSCLKNLYEKNQTETLDLAKLKINKNKYYTINQNSLFWD